MPARRRRKVFFPLGKLLIASRIRTIFAAYAACRSRWSVPPTHRRDRLLPQVPDRQQDDFSSWTLWEYWLDRFATCRASRPATGCLQCFARDSTMPLRCSVLLNRVLTGQATALMLRAMFPQRNLHMRLLRFRRQAQRKVKRWRLAYQRHRGLSRGRIQPGLVAEYPLIKSATQFRQRAAYLLVFHYLGMTGGNTVPIKTGCLFLFHQFTSQCMIGHAIPPYALDVIECHRHVFRAEIQINLAAVVAVVGTLPAAADHAAMLILFQLGKRRLAGLSIPFRHAGNNIHQASSGAHPCVCAPLSKW